MKPPVLSVVCPLQQRGALFIACALCSVLWGCDGSASSSDAAADAIKLLQINSLRG